MINRFNYIDNIFNNDSSIDRGLSVCESRRPCLRIFRMLSGSCEINDSFYDRRYNINRNYITFPFSESEIISREDIVGIFSEDIEENDLSLCFRRMSENDDIYSAIEFELINCLLSRINGRYLESFLFLYRILEGISYSIPLIYVSKQKSYKKSFNALKKFISKSSKDGEIAFFKKFVNETFKNKEFYRSTIDIDLNEIEFEELRPTYYQIYKSKLEQDCIAGETEDEELKVTFVGFFSFMIEIRNRYFHFLQGTWQDNIETSQVVFPDEFFKPIIDHGINWVGIILFEVIQFDMENQVR